MARRSALQRPILREAPSVDVVGTLGSDPAAAVSRLVREFMQEKHDECGGSREKIAVFCRSHDELLSQAWARISAYEKACIRYRIKNRLQPFSWPRENEDTIRAVLRKKKNQKAGPLSPAAMAARRNAYIAMKDSSIWRQPIRHKVDFETLAYTKNGGIEPPSYRRSRKKAEPFEWVFHDVTSRYLASGVFRSLQNTKGKL